MYTDFTNLLKIIEESEQCFRRGMEGAGNDILVQILDSLSFLLQNQPNINTESLNNILAEILNGQQQRDCIRIADGLYYKLRPWLLDLIVEKYPTGLMPEQ